MKYFDLPAVAAKFALALLLSTSVSFAEGSIQADGAESVPRLILYPVAETGYSIGRPADWVDVSPAERLQLKMKAREPGFNPSEYLEAQKAIPINFASPGDPVKRAEIKVAVLPWNIAKDGVPLEEAAALVLENQLSTDAKAKVLQSPFADRVAGIPAVAFKIQTIGKVGKEEWEDSYWLMSVSNGVMMMLTTRRTQDNETVKTLETILSSLTRTD